MPYDNKKPTPNLTAVADLRRQLPLILPAFIFLSVGCWVMCFEFLAEMIQDLVLQAPFIRITPGLVLAPVIMPLVFILDIFVILVAIPGGRSIFENSKFLRPLFGRALNFLALLVGGVMVLIITSSTLLQGYFMPNLGYSRCSSLQGSPSMWHSDWVQNPAWCVRGKSPEWVYEQAGWRDTHSK